MKKVGKTTRPFMYDLNKTPYDMVEATNRLKGIGHERVPQELWMEVCNIVLEVVTKTIPKRNARRQNGCLRRPYKHL